MLKQASCLSRKKAVAVLFGISTAVLLSGAAFVPPLLNSQTLPAPLFETPMTVITPIIQILPQPVLKPHAHKGRLAERLNDRYRTGRGLQASA